MKYKISLELLFGTFCHQLIARFQLYDFLYPEFPSEVQIKTDFFKLNLIIEKKVSFRKNLIYSKHIAQSY